MCGVSRGSARVRAVYFLGGGAFDVLPIFSQLRCQKNSELTQQNGRGKKTANLVWPSVTAILFEMILRQTSLSFKQMCLQRPEKTENINVEWGSRHTTQVIDQRLSQTSVLPLPSCSVNSLITALARGLPSATKTGTLPSHDATATPVKKSLKKTYLASFQTISW